jgi:glutamate-1-semialdehyde aminotransferase
MYTIAINYEAIKAKVSYEELIQALVKAKCDIKCANVTEYVQDKKNGYSEPLYLKVNKAVVVVDMKEEHLIDFIQTLAAVDIDR